MTSQMPTRTFFVAVCLLGAAAIPVATRAATRVRRPATSQEVVDWTTAASDMESVVLQIDGVRPGNADDGMNAQTVVALAQSTAVSGPAIERALGLTGSEGRSAVLITAQATGTRFVGLSVSLRAAGLRADGAQVVLRELALRLQAAVNQSSAARTRATAGRREALQKQLAAAQDQYAHASAAMQAARTRGGSGLADNTRYQRQTLTQQKQTTELELVGLKARLAALLANGNAPATTPPATAPSTPSKTATPLTPTVPPMRAAAESFSPGYRNNEMDIPALRASIAEDQARLDLLVQQIAALPPDEKPTMGDADVSQLQADEQRARSVLNAAQSAMEEFDRFDQDRASVTLTILDGSDSPPAAQATTAP